MSKVLLVLEYEGTRYSGFQLQQGSTPTIQGCIENAIFMLTNERTRLIGASRTDAGVHAEGQVATFETKTSFSLDKYRSGLNHYLPSDITVRKSAFVNDHFNPRRDARSRTYRYSILNRYAPSAIHRKFTLHWRSELDVDLMRKAAENLVGEHDMLSFISNPIDNIITIRNFSSAKVLEENEMVIIEMEANGFLPQQIRRTTGALMRVGQEKLSIEEFAQMIQCPRRGAAPWSLPPNGLSLIKVNYCHERLDESIYENV